MPTPRPVRRPSPSAPSTWRVVCIAALCSFVAGAATSWMIVRRSVASASSASNTTAPVAATPLPDNFPLPPITHNDPPPPSGDSPVPVYTSQVSVLNTPPGPPLDPARLFAEPAAAAASSVDIANTVLQVSEFVNTTEAPGAGGHIDLYNNLIVLKLAAEAMMSDNGSDPVKTARLNATLYTQIEQAGNRANTIATRDTETEEAKQVSAKLRDSLRALRGK
jgi:hypothetical protein